MNDESHAAPAAAAASTPASLFWSRLFAIQEGDNRAALAKLRRAVNDPAYSDVYATIGSSIPKGLHERDEELYLFIASLFAIYPSRGRKTSLGRSLGLLRSRMSVGQESLDGRFAAILNADPEDITVHLRHLVSLMGSKDVQIDYPRLLNDLLQWGRDDKRVQRTWARDYWTPVANEGTANDAANTEGESDGNG